MTQEEGARQHRSGVGEGKEAKSEKVGAKAGLISRLEAACARWPRSLRESAPRSLPLIAADQMAASRRRTGCRVAEAQTVNLGS